MINEGNIYSDIKGIISKARQKAHGSVNFIMVEAYWNVGKRIVLEEQSGQKRAAYGEGLIKKLSKELSQDFGKGFSVANLENFRKFYLTFQGEQIPYAVRRELSWTHFRLIIRVGNPKARDYYIKESAEQFWSTRQLERNINSHYFERLLSSRQPRTEMEQDTKFEKTSAADFIKDPMVMEFLGLPEVPQNNEHNIETAIINNLQSFLLEMGKGFSFVSRQLRISTETSHFYIDLVFYNYLLKCFVLIDLKAGKLTHQDVGQMDMYVRMFDDLKRQPDDNPTIGLILCSSRDETIVKYSVLKESEQMFASKYRLILPREEELIAELERERRLFLEGHENA